MSSAEAMDGVEAAKQEFLICLKAIRGSNARGREFLHDLVEPMHEAAVRYYRAVERTIRDSANPATPASEFQTLGLAGDCAEALATYVRYRKALATVLSEQAGEDLSARYPPSAATIGTLQAAVSVLLPDERRRLHVAFVDLKLPTDGFDNPDLANALARAWSPGRPTAKAPTLLWMSANPVGTVHLEIDRELREVRQDLPHDASVNFQTWGAVHKADFIDLFNRFTPHVAHFSGHGDGNGVVVAGERGYETLSIQGLVNLVKAIPHRIDLMVLSACYTAANAKALAGIVEAAIGTRGKILNHVARKFNVRLYRSMIAQRQTLQDSFDQAIALLNGDDYTSEAAKIEIHYANSNAKDFKLLP